MNTPLPLLADTPAEVQGLLTSETAGHKPPRLQALSRVQRPQARPRRPVAHLLGGAPRLVTRAKAPGKGPAVPHAGQDARRHRWAPPEGGASDQARWPWVPHDSGLALAATPGPRLVRAPRR